MSPEQERDPRSTDERDDLAPSEDGSFVDQTLLSDPAASAGPSDGPDDPVQEGDDVYVPPTDPVIRTNARGDAEVLGGFSASSLDDVSVERSSDGTLGDEAIADAIRRELREDAATTDLEVDVRVRGGVAKLRGVVEGPEDADNAMEVAARVPGVADVVDRTKERWG